METGYRRFIPAIAAEDAVEVVSKDREYGASWLRRGGVGAYFVAIRKLDRIEEQLKHFHWDVFEALKHDRRKEGLVDDIRDFRRYLLLWEAEAIRQGLVPESPVQLFQGDAREDLLEAAWGIIANAHHSNWDEATPDWREAAERWRDGYHKSRNISTVSSAVVVDDPLDRLQKATDDLGALMEEKPDESAVESYARRSRITVSEARRILHDQLDQIRKKAHGAPR